jgi:ERO1-like protein alpha
LFRHHTEQQLANTCLEKRVFFRLISGLHSSINVHLAAKYLHGGVTPINNQLDHWGPNTEQFKARFDPERTNGLGPQWLKNIYFIYLVELRALEKAAPYLLSKPALFYTGGGGSSELAAETGSTQDEEDKDLILAVSDLLVTIKSFKSHFDERALFRGDEAKQLREQFQSKFRNITRIMDCVGCDKCRLWGKVQTLGLGTALKILFNNNDEERFQLSRSEIVALFNGFARLSNSIAEIENFREILERERQIVNQQPNGANNLFGSINHNNNNKNNDSQERPGDRKSEL